MPVVAQRARATSLRCGPAAIGEVMMSCALPAIESTSGQPASSDSENPFFLPISSRHVLWRSSGAPTSISRRRTPQGSFASRIVTQPRRSATRISRRRVVNLHLCLGTGGRMHLVVCPGGQISNEEIPHATSKCSGRTGRNRAGRAGMVCDGGGGSATEIVLGQSAITSGPLGVPIKALNSGAQLAFDAVNAQGGVHGRKIRVITLDDELAPPKAVANYKKLIEEQGVVAMFGCVGSGTTAAAARRCKTTAVPRWAALRSRIQRARRSAATPSSCVRAPSARPRSWFGSSHD